MDILAKYEAENPHIVRHLRQTSIAPEYGFFVRLIMGLSGGKIQDARRANTVLFGITLLIMATAVLIFIFAGSATQISSPGPAPL